MTAQDKFVGVDTPAIGAETVTPSNSAELEQVSRALWIGTAGNVRVMTYLNQDVTFNNVQDGTLLPVQVRQVFSTGTTATDIVSVY